jgi:hypothetical protein
VIADRRWRWWRCPTCGNVKAGKRPGGGRIVGERLTSLRAAYAPPIHHPHLGVRDALTIEVWELRCPCGHAWGATREV